jgi:phosphate transport system substrate-binding protein
MKGITRGVLVLLMLGTLILLSACGGAGSEASDSSESSEGPQRAIQNKGSDTLVNVALAWAEAYREVEPEVSIAVTGGGSGTGIAALINGTVDIAIGHHYQPRQSGH